MIVILTVGAAVVGLLVLVTIGMALLMAAFPEDDWNESDF